MLLEMAVQEDAKLLRRAFRQLEKCFKQADSDGSGLISREELRHFLSLLNGMDPPFDDDEVCQFADVGIVFGAEE